MAGKLMTMTVQDRARPIRYVGNLMTAHLILIFGRSDLQHHLLKLTWADQLATIDVAKRDGVHRVLDVGTGTGIWAIEWGKVAPYTSKD